MARWIADLAVAALIILAVVGIAWVVINEMGIPIPPALIKIGVILLLVMVGIYAIRFIVSRTPPAPPPTA